VATFTQLGDQQRDRITASHDLGAIARWKEIEAGTINSNFFVETARGKFFIRVNEGKTLSQVEEEMALVTQLARAGVPTPLPVVTRQGRAFSEVDGHLICVFPWIDGEHIEASQVRELHVKAIGSGLAQIHLCGDALEFCREGSYTHEEIDGRFSSFRDREDPALRAAIRAVGKETGHLAAQADLRSRVPKGVIHGDLFRDNVLFRDDELVGVIDFEQASRGAMVYDLAVCINAWCFVDDFCPDLVAALVGAYESRRPLGNAERADLWVELRAAAMRFLVTRITDVYLPGIHRAEKDFRRYLRRLERWRQIGPDTLEQWIWR